MQRILFLCLLVCAVLSAQDSELNQLQLVGQPRQLQSEIVAVRDANQRFCAGIKVISDMDNFTYQSYNGVVQVDDRPGEDGFEHRVFRRDQWKSSSPGWA